MTDKLSPAHRSENMRRIKSKNMKPEMVVRSIVHQMGFRYRLHRRNLPGKPDLVFAPRKKVIFVHGCFWHGHDDPACPDGRRQPKSNLDDWLPKLARNKERDAAHAAALAGLGWSAMTVWECDLKREERLTHALRHFLDASA